MKRAAFFFLLIIQCTYGQNNNEADSLINLLNKTSNIKEKSRLMFGIAENYSIDSPKGIAWYNKHLAFAIKHNLDTTGSLNALGVHYLNTQQYDIALKYLLRAIDAAKKYKRHGMTATIYSHISIIFQEQGNFSKSLYYDNKALEISRLIKDTIGIADNYMSSGITYSEIGNNKKALALFKKALSYYIKKNSTEKVAYAYFNIGFVTDDLTKRVEYLEKAKIFFDSYDSSNPLAVSNLNNLAETYFLLSEDEGLSAKVKSSSAALLKKAENMVNEAVSYNLKDNNRYNLMFSYEVLSKIKEAQNKPNEALDYTRRQFALKDSLFSQQQKNNIATTESEAQIALRDKQLELNRVMLETRERQFWILFGGILLFTGFLVLLFMQNKARKAQNKNLERLNAELDRANKTKTQLFGIINHDLRGPVASLINFLNLQKQGVLDDDKAKELQAKTMKSANGLLQSMEDLLLWSKGQMEYFKPDLKSISAQSLFDDIAALYTGAPIYFIDNEGIVFTSDENYLKTIMRNLTSNALKAAHNTANARIEWIAFEKNGRKYLSITDNGHGATIDSFNALHGNSIDIGIKNGLGLHLIHELALGINCAIEVETNAGGTTVTLAINQ